MTNANVKAIKTEISSVKTSEKNTGKRVPSIVTNTLKLAIAGGEPATNVGDLANRLLNSVTPANKKLILSVFRPLIPFQYDTETEAFTKMLGGKNAEKRIARAAEFVESGASVWDYAKGKDSDDNQKETRAQKVAKTIKTGLNAKKDALTTEALADALKESGVNVSELIAYLNH